MLYSIIGMLVIIFDQLVKFWVDRNINWTNPTRPLIPGIISLVRVQNDGAAFSFLSGSGARVWFIVLTGVFAFLVVIALATHFISGKFGSWCLVLVTAGGLSNMIDRIRYGFVIDMFKVELFDFAVFNVADIFITVFCIAFILYILFGGEKQREVNEDEFDEIDYEEYDRPRREPLKSSLDRENYSDDRPAKRAPAKKVTSKQLSEEFDVDYTEKERSHRISSSASPNAYKRRSLAEPSAEKASQQKRQRPTGQEIPSQSRQRRSAPSNEASVSQINKNHRSAFPRKSAEDLDIEKFLSSEISVNKQYKTSVNTGSPAVRKSVASTSTRQRNDSALHKETKTPVYDPDNPFAEWEQANRRASEKNEFNSFTEVEKEDSIPDQDFSAKTIDKNFSSADFSLDDILDEFK